MRLPAPHFIIGLISLATRVRCVSASSDLFSPSAPEEEPTSDLLANGNLDDWTITSFPGEARLEFSDDFSNGDLLLESDFLATSPGDEIVLNDRGAVSSCAQPLGKRDVAQDDLVLCRHQIFHLFSSDHHCRRANEIMPLHIADSCINSDLPPSDHSNLDIEKNFSEFIDTLNDEKVKDRDPVTDYFPMAPLMPYLLMRPRWDCPHQQFSVCCTFGSQPPPHNCIFCE